MTIPILNTKLYIPKRPEKIVSRKALIELLCGESARRLTLVSAPAGYGKTTLISEWIEKSEHLFCWITLDESDNDPKRFLSYLLAALGTIGIEIHADIINTPQTFQDSSPEALLIPIINQLSECNDPIGIVLDDYHQISDTRVHALVDFFIEHSPPHVQIVLGTRSDPPLSIGKLRVRNQLNEIRESDLKFGAYEARVLFNQLNDYEIGPSNIEVIINRTGGWIAGLQMAAMALKDQPDPNEYLRAFDGRHDYIVDFLTSEVFHSQPAEIKEFLLFTSILDRFNWSLCEAVSGQPDTKRILKTLKDENVFLVVLDERSEWFSYNQLFRDLLEQRLLERYPTMMGDLYRKASVWFETNQFHLEAIRYAVRGGIYEEAIRLIEDYAEETISRGEVATLINWIKQIPEEMVRQSMLINIYYAYALLIGRESASQVDRLIELIEANAQGFEGERYALRAFQAIFKRDFSQAIALGDKALAHLPEEAYFFRQMTAWNLSAAYTLKGDMDAGEKLLKEVASLSRLTGNLMGSVVSLCRLGELHLQRGQLDLARGYYLQALESARNGKENLLPSACEAYFGLGKIDWERYELDSALKNLSDGLILSKRWREISTIDCHIVMANIFQSQGKPEQASSAMHRAIEITQKNKFTQMGMNYVDSQAVSLALRQHDDQILDAWARKQSLAEQFQSQELAATGSVAADTIRNYELIVYARALIYEGSLAEADELLERLLPLIDAMGHMVKCIEIKVLISLIQLRRGKEVGAVSVLQEALEQAHIGNYQRVFIDEGPEIFQLIRRIKRAGYVTKLVEEILASDASVEEVILESPAQPAERILEPLSGREIEVLRLLVTELTVPEIADHLVITVSTLRTHIRNIYQKLGAHSRYEAVSKAREIGVI